MSHELEESTPTSAWQPPKVSDEILKKAALHIAAARFKLQKEYPYFSKLLWSIQLMPTPGLAELAGGNIGIDKWWRLYYDPEEILHWAVSELVTVLAEHEFHHPLRQSFERAEVLAPLAKAQGLTQKSFRELTNLAQDASINDDATTDGKTFPRPTPSKPAGPNNEAWTTKTLNEKIYKQHKIKLGLKPHDIWENHYHTLLEKLPRDPNGENDWGDSCSAPNCGSAAHGQQQSWEQGPKPGQGGQNASKDFQSGISPGEAKLIQKAVAQDIQHELQNGKQAGNIPAGLRRWAEELLNPKIPWRNELRAQVRRAVARAMGCVDYTYSKRSRRSPFKNLFSPAMFAPVPDIAIAIDTSGSMSAKALQQARSEVHGVLKAIGADKRVRVYSGDTEIGSAQQVNDARKVNLVGGGGTNMTVLLEHMGYVIRPRPHIAILITDMETPWPEKPLPIPTIIVGVELYGRDVISRAPKWAKVIVADDLG